ncbi:MAG TPA: hypothetical protein VK169_02590 [Saprospiraceae bacterium]|nr:hypothetical protein [Saprospiraceae bacterium]
MNRVLVLVCIITLFISCKTAQKEKAKTEVLPDFQEVIHENYELSKPKEDISNVLVLFGGYPEKPENIKREFTIIDIAKENNIAVLYMNYHQKLWLEDDEKQKLASLLQSIFVENKLPTKNIFIGGFSSGGNVSLLISSFLMEHKEFNLAPKGVFIIDSPIDLMALYKSSEKNIKRKFSETSVQESTWIIETLEKRFGHPNSNLSKYEDYTVFTSQSNNIDNLSSLKNIKIRLYTEPDTLWWKTNRMADYDQMNAFYIKKLHERLKASGFNRIEYIPTLDKGYRANGDRHPHSWSIVDKNELVAWMKE